MIGALCRVKQVCVCVNYTFTRLHAPYTQNRLATLSRNLMDAERSVWWNIFHRRGCKLAESSFVRFFILYWEELREIGMQDSILGTDFFLIRVPWAVQASYLFILCMWLILNSIKLWVGAPTHPLLPTPTLRSFLLPVTRNLGSPRLSPT